MDRVAHEGSNAVRRALMKHRALARTASGQGVCRSTGPDGSSYVPPTAANPDPEGDKKSTRRREMEIGQVERVIEIERIDETVPVPEPEVVPA